MTRLDEAATTWVFVDDNPNDAEAYRDALQDGEMAHRVTILRPLQARKALLTGEVSPTGVLMDVDLSGEEGSYGTGLGLAQDVRAAQKSGKIGEFPVIRFANREPVQRNIGGDPASDDLFDDKIEKTEVGVDREDVQRRMRAVEVVYAELGGISDRGSNERLLHFLGLDEQKAEAWLHPGFLSRLIDGHTQAIHVAAGILCRTALAVPGLLIDRPLLQLRLGLGANLTNPQREALERFAAPFAYSGVGGEQAPRWWARGLEETWYGLEGAVEALAMTDAADRAALISRTLGVDFQPFEPVRTSPGSRPWRWCALSQEKSPSELVGIDPRFSVRMTPRGETPPWVDPVGASFGQAIRVRDSRLNPADLERLKAVFN